MANVLDARPDISDVSKLRSSVEGGVNTYTTAADRPSIATDRGLAQTDDRQLKYIGDASRPNMISDGLATLRICTSTKTTPATSTHVTDGDDGIPNGHTAWRYIALLSGILVYATNNTGTTPPIFRLDTT